MQELDDFVNSNAHNVTLGGDYDPDLTLGAFEAILQGAWVGEDVGAVKVYSVDNKYVAWIDYERNVGYIL